MKPLDRDEYNRRFPTGSTEQIMLAAEAFASEVREAIAYNEGDFSMVGYAVQEFLMKLRDLRVDENTLAEAAEYSAKTLRELANRRL